MTRFHQFYAETCGYTWKPVYVRLDEIVMFHEFEIDGESRVTLSFNRSEITVKGTAEQLRELLELPENES